MIRARTDCRNPSDVTGNWQTGLHSDGTTYTSSSTSWHYRDLRLRLHTPGNGLFDVLSRQVRTICRVELFSWHYSGQLTFAAERKPFRYCTVLFAARCFHHALFNPEYVHPPAGKCALSPAVGANQHSATPLHPGPLSQRHDLSAQFTGPRPPVCLSQRISGELSRQLLADRAAQFAHFWNLPSQKPAF